MKSLLACALFGAFALGCGGGGGGGGGGGDGGVTDCTTTDDCPTGQQCNLGTGTCEPTPCTSNTDCHGGSYCADSGTCAGNTTGGPCAGDDNCSNGEVCTGGFCGCTGDEFSAEGVPPNVLIVLDRSGSMDEALGNSTKWEVAVDALGQLLTTYGDQVRWGLVLYEGASQCAPGQIEVDVGAGTAGMINTALGNTGPGGRTPIGDTLDGLIGYAGLADTTRENYILLLTDGSETCGGDGVTAVTDLRAQTPEVKTFVVGFGSGVDANQLDDMATAGGTALPGGPPYYYQADDAASLQAAFDSIGAAVLSCTYALSGNPDSSTLHVFFDSLDVPRDPSHGDGWDYDPAAGQITFYGAACDDLRSGSVTDLVVVSGCAIGRELGAD
ncbi:MAG: VWA domain-containing protein [Kofleriaceae bacterium]|nr:VWA domain-containing protein [Myxococcales bacterium]MCB9559056.1 VWA domain-containing protein [Kofleriaceae bacterium]